MPRARRSPHIHSEEVRWKFVLGQDLPLVKVNGYKAVSQRGKTHAYVNHDGKKIAICGIRLVEHCDKIFTGPAAFMTCKKCEKIMNS